MCLSCRYWCGVGKQIHKRKEGTKKRKKGKNKEEDTEKEKRTSERERQTQEEQEKERKTLETQTNRQTGKKADRRRGTPIDRQRERGNQTG